MLNKTSEKGIIAWFASNPVAANLLMISILLIGGVSALNIKKAITPDFESNKITVTMVYPGAAPIEVEKGLIVRIEDAIKDIEGIQRIESRAQESLAMVTIETHKDYDVLTILDEVKINIDSISSFPQEAEKPVIKRRQPSYAAVQLQIHGNIDQFNAKYLAEEIKQELLQDPDVGKVDIWGTRDYEITIEVPESQLRKYGLTLRQVADIIRARSLDLPGGAIRTSNGNIMLRTKSQAYQQQDYEDIVLITFADGTRIKLGDIATINDGFVEVSGFASFDGTYSVGMAVSAVGKQDIIQVSEAVKRYVNVKRQSLPEGVYLTDWADSTFYLEGRLEMMLKNLAIGALLVCLILGLFMDMNIAFWVMMGLPISFLGTFIFLPLEAIDVSINMISLFGFILVLGIVVDDAIIIGESAHSYTLKHGDNLDNVIRGTKRVAVPATFGVLTTICAFAPTLFVEGVWTNFPAACGWVVLFCLMFSLLESKWILPSHLAHRNTGFSRYIRSNKQMALQQNCNRLLQDFVNSRYRTMLHKAIDNRYITLASFIGVLVITIGLVGGGVVRYIMHPDPPNDYIRGQVEMVRGTAEQSTYAAMRRMVAAIHKVNNDYQQETGDQRGFIRHIFSWGQDGRIANYFIELNQNENRKWSSNEISERWRKETGEIAGAKKLAFGVMSDDAGPDIGYNLVGDNWDHLEAAANLLTDKLRSYNGVMNIENGASDTILEAHLELKPQAEALGLTQMELGRQVREAFYGAEAQRIQRGNDEVKVMVRYPLDQRASMSDLESMYIRSADGTEVPIQNVARIEMRPGYSQTTRINGERAINVSARVNKDLTEPNTVTMDLEKNIFPEIKSRYPSVDIKMDGGTLESKKMESSLFKGFSLALLGIYVLLAIPLRSYVQPIIIMSVIPFGIVGAVIGHIAMGLAISMMSVFGIIALSGVVVNDSLIMVDFINRARAQGEDIRSAVVNSGCERFRAILLTSLTTFFGILPMLLESSVQAQFVIPMAVSLGFGIVFSTVITLVLVPCLYQILNDFHYADSKLKTAPGSQS